SYPFMEMGRRDKSRGGNSTSSSSPRFYDIASDNDISDNDRKFVGGGSDRHSLLLIPAANLTFNLSWKQKSPSSHPYQHHCVYNHTPSQSLPDKFDEFRSTSLSLDLDFVVAGDNVFSPWVALRIDVLPWIEHKFVADADDTALALKNANPELHPPPELVISTLRVSAVCKDLRVALWYGIYDTDGLCLTLPLVTVLSNSQRGLNKDKEEVLISESSQLDIGETKAALLDIVHCYEFDMLGEDKMKKDGRAMFYLLQQWYSNISEFDYLVEANSVVILDHPFSAETTIEELLAFWGTVAVDVVGTLNEKSKKTSFGGGNVGKPTFSSFKRNHDLLRPPDTNLPKYQQHTRRASLFTDSSSPLKTLEKKRLNSNSS
ncbi:hypothetical protein ScalyP_jg10203, partial [Parmales sp. scaly parma]